MVTFPDVMLCGVQTMPQLRQWMVGVMDRAPSIFSKHPRYRRSVGRQMGPGGAEDGYTEPRPLPLQLRHWQYD